MEDVALSMHDEVIAMIHDETIIPLRGDQELSIGCTMCFSEPALSLIVARRLGGNHRVEVLCDLTIQDDELDALIAALTSVRDVIARHTSNGP